MMKTTQPLTLEQRQYAEDHHNLVYSFLRFRNLSYDYYDIAAFGYLRAVRKYFERPELRQYEFSTIAYAAMNTNLHNHYQKQRRKKRLAYVVSFDTVSDDSIGVEDDTVSNLLLEEVLSELPTYQANVILMKREGYTEREIAKKHNVSAKSIQEMLSSIREAIYPKLV